jgi:hypothetical protein
VIGSQNISSIDLELKTDRYGDLARVRLLIFMPMSIVGAVWNQEADAGSGLTGGDITVYVDRPWDLHIILAATSPALACQFNNSESSTLLLSGKETVCSAPITGEDISLELTIVGGPT